MDYPQSVIDQQKTTYQFVQLEVNNQMKQQQQSEPLLLPEFIVGNFSCDFNLNEPCFILLVKIDKIYLEDFTSQIFDLSNIRFCYSFNESFNDSIPVKLDNTRFLLSSKTNLLKENKSFYTNENLQKTPYIYLKIPIKHLAKKTLNQFYYSFEFNYNNRKAINSFGKLSFSFERDVNLQFKFKEKQQNEWFEYDQPLVYQFRIKPQKPLNATGNFEYMQNTLLSECIKFTTLPFYAWNKETNSTFNLEYNLQLHEKNIPDEFILQTLQRIMVLLKKPCLLQETILQCNIGENKTDNYKIPAKLRFKAQNKYELIFAKFYYNIDEKQFMIDSFQWEQSTFELMRTDYLKTTLVFDFKVQANFNYHVTNYYMPTESTIKSYLNYELQLNPELSFSAAKTGISNSLKLNAADFQILKNNPSFHFFENYFEDMWFHEI